MQPIRNRIICGECVEQIKEILSLTGEMEENQFSKDLKQLPKSMNWLGGKIKNEKNFNYN